MPQAKTKSTGSAKSCRNCRRRNRRPTLPPTCPFNQFRLKVFLNFFIFTVKILMELIDKKNRANYPLLFSSLCSVKIRSSFKVIPVISHTKHIGPQTARFNQITAKYISPTEKPTNHRQVESNCPEEANAKIEKCSITT